MLVKPIFDNPYNKTYTVYTLLFTCATTRNVHLELTPAMNTNSLTRAIVRFRSRRADVRLFISDNFQTLKSTGGAVGGGGGGGGGGGVDGLGGMEGWRGWRGGGVGGAWAVMNAWLKL